MAQTIEQFGQTIKAKYPQYNDIPDAELGQKMLVKYPQYKDMVSGTPAAPAQPTDNRDLLDKASDVVGSIFPGQQVGKTIGTLAGYGYTAGKEALGMLPKGTTAQYDLSAPTPLQLGGDIAKGAAMVAGLKVPLPVAATIPAAIGKTALQFGGLGALSGAGSAAASGGDLKKIASSAFWSGLTGAVVGGVVGGASKAIQNLAQKGPEALYNNALNISTKIKAAGKSPASFLADEGVWGGLGSMTKQAQQGIADEGTKIAAKVADSTATATYDELKQAAMDRLASKYGSLYSEADLARMVDNVPVNALKNTADGTFDMTTLNNTRSQLGRLVGDTKWLQTTPTESTSAAQAMYRAMAEKIQSETDTAQEFSRQSKWIEANKALGKAIFAADKKWLPGFYDWVSGAVGSTIGILGGNPIAGGLTGVAVERAARSPAVITAGAQALSKLPTDIGPAVQAVRGITTPAIGNIVGN